MAESAHPSPESQTQATAEPAPTPVRPVSVGWVSGGGAFHRLGRTLGPLSVGLLDEFVHPTVMCPEKEDTFALPTPPVNVHTYEQGKWFSKPSRTAESLAEGVRGRKLNLLHALDGAAVDLTRALAGQLDLPYLVSCYSAEDAKRLPRQDPRMVGVLPACKATKAALRRRKVCPPEALHLLRPGVHRVRRANCFNNPEQSVCVATCGVLDRSKPYAALLKAFASVKASQADSVLFVIGNGPAERTLREQASKLGIGQETTFSDAIPSRQLAGIFKSADVYVSAADRPELDVYSLLAMAAGVPVVAAAGGNSDFLIDGQTAMLYPRGDAAALGEKLLSLMADQQAARDQAQNALAYVGEHHSPAVMVSKLADIYRQTLAAGE